MQTTLPSPITSPQSARALVPASRGTRLQAAIIDGLIAVAIYIVALVARMPALLFAGIITLAIYQIYLLSTQGQTIGKRISNIKVVTVDTETNGGFLINVGMRTLLNALISLVPFYALADVLFIFREDRRCIHDMIAGTKVVEA